MRIHQVWIILNNGVCPLHLLYKGQQLDENLFAGFVRALFSFSKDMSSGEKSISAMSFGDMEIHYLAHPEEKYFVAIAADSNAAEESCYNYLKYISDLFMTNYPKYIETLPPFEPKSFVYFKDSMDHYIRFYEDQYLINHQSKPEIQFERSIIFIQTSLNHFILQFEESSILKLLNKRDLNLLGTFYPENGNVKYFSIQNEGNYLSMVSDTNFLSIKPIYLHPSENEYENLNEKIEDKISWLMFHPTEMFTYFGNENEVIQFDIQSNIKQKIFVDQNITKVLIHKTNKIFVINDKNELYYLKIPLKEEKTELNKVELEDQVFSLNYGPGDILILKCINEIVYFWDTKENLIQIQDRFPNTSEVSYSEEHNLIFFITENKEFFIYETNGNRLVNYNLINSAIGATVDEQGNLFVIYNDGNLKPFPATIDRDNIAQLRQILSKRVDTVENHINRIYSGFQKIVENLETKRTSTHIKRDLNQIKVFKQQLKRLIDPKLLERTSILRDIYFRLREYETQVQKISKLVLELEGNLDTKLKEEKENELSGKSSKERIDEYLEKMKPRQSIGIGILSDHLQLPYQEVLNYIQKMEQSGLLSGFLTRGTGTSLKDSVIFVKKDPKFKESGITSF